MHGNQLTCGISLVIILGLLSSAGDASPENPIMAYDFLYNEGVEKYLNEDWDGCVSYMEKALEDWHWWQDNVIVCRRNCSAESSKEELFSFEFSEESRFFERSVRNTLCLLKCKKEVFGSRMDRVAEGNVDDDFSIRKPYDYLQLCYYKTGKMKLATDAAATVLAKQPDHEVMQNNLKIYLSDGVIKAEDVVNRELKQYGIDYIKGNDAYNDNDYTTTIELMERSLASYYIAEDDCRQLCEKPFDQGWFPDFISSIANHYTYTLRCKLRCDHELSNLYGEPIENFLASYFNYLQYSYFQVGDHQKACEAVASSLVLYPNDEVQLRNKEYYLKDEEIDKDMFVPREEIVAFRERHDYEVNMMNFIETNFVFLNENNLLEDIDDDDAKNTEMGSTSLEGSGGGSVILNSSSLEPGLDATQIFLDGDVAKDEF